MPQHRLSRDQVIWSFGPDLTPVLEIEPGDVVTFETNDCFTGQICSEDDLVTGIDFGRINSATGPVAVRGAEPGDSLVAEILDVRPIEWGVATLIPGFGQLDHVAEAPLTRLFEVRDGIVKMNERVSFPARPMVGVVGVATANETISNGRADRHGGNLDDHLHGRGARIYFPVRQTGGMFGVGDMHASMGDGEICFTGVEIAGEVDIRFELLKGKQATWPVTELHDRWVPHATAPDYAEAGASRSRRSTRARGRSGCSPLPEGSICDDRRRMQHVAVTLLGGFEVRVDGDPVPASAWTHGRARDLVKLLALARDHRLPRDRVLDDLWPQLGAEAAHANLHKAAHHARRALGDADGLVLRGGLVMLAPDARVETDVERFEASPDPRLYPGELLPDDPYVPWAEEPRRALRSRYLDALRGAGRWEELAEEDPADEPAQLAVMRARFAAGDRPGAIRAFERLTAALQTLGLQPGLEALALNARIAGGAAFDKALAAVERALAEAPVAERADLLATRADLLMATGDRGAPAAYAEAAAAAGPEGMALRIRQAWAQLVSGDPNAARATLAPLAPGSDRERVAHLLAQGASAWFSGDADAAGRIAADAEALALANGLTREARMSVQIQVMVAHSTGDWPAAVQSGLDTSLLSPDLADTLFDGHMCVAEFALTSGAPLERIRAVAAELYGNATRSGARRAQIFAATLLGEIALVTGASEEAEARLREAVRLSREIGAVSAEALASVRLGEAARARGQLAEGDQLLSDALVISRWSPISGHLLPLGYAAFLRASDDPALGGRRLDDAAAYLREQELVCAYCGMAFRVAASITAARADAVEAATMFLMQAEATAGLWRDGGPWPAAIDEARGELALASGDLTEASERLRLAGDAFAQHGRLLDADRVTARLTSLA